MYIASDLQIIVVMKAKYARSPEKYVEKSLAV